jgi:hypothetical protein
VEIQKLQSEKERMLEEIHFAQQQMLSTQKQLKSLEYISFTAKQNYEMEINTVSQAQNLLDLI